MDKIYKEHAQTVYAFLLIRCKDEHLAEELTQETFYQAMKSIDSFQGNSQISTWLCAIAKNVWSTYLKKKKDEVLVEDIDLFGENLLEKKVFTQMETMNVLEAIHHLGEPMKEIMYLRLIGDLSYRQIGDIFHQSENWARVNYFRAKQTVIKEIKKHEK